MEATLRIRGGSIADRTTLERRIALDLQWLLSLEAGIANARIGTIASSIRELTSTRPDPAGFVRCAGQLLGGLSRPRTLAPPPLRVSTRGSWMERGRGPRVDLSRRTVLGKTVVVLARERIDSPGSPLDVPALSAACWPGERILPTAAANRVYVAISGLRRLGLGTDLEHIPDGYRIAPSIPCELVDA